jgi:endoglucanase
MPYGRNFRWWAGLAAVGLGVGLVAGTGAPAVGLAAETAATATAAPQLHVSGTELVNQAGARVVLHGVDRSGGEYMCVQTSSGMWDGPMNQAAVNAMKTWKVTAVRVPLNEACWNGESYVKGDKGTTYRDAVKAYVSLLNRNGIVAILDLHWTDGAYTGSGGNCTSAQALCQKPMPDEAQAPKFWKSVASTFKGNDAVIFDLFNEPFPDVAGGSTTEGWRCWRSGGTCTGISYKVAGMQALVNAVRSTGATNVIMLGGLTWANDLVGWAAHEPTDPDHNLVASWHSYNFNACVNRSCWNSQIAPVIAKVPLITGEMGENDCADTYIDPLMSWLDARSTSYLAWAWNADFACTSGPGLISNYGGVPTKYGLGYRAHLQKLG